MSCRIRMNENDHHKYEDVNLETLPQHRNWNGAILYRYNDFWFPEMLIHGVLRSENNFKAQGTDIILATMPKSGTTWLKALVFSIVNRHKYSNSQLEQSPLLFSNPHSIVPFLEIDLYRAQENPDGLDSIPSPRIFATHVPHRVLPRSISGSGCKMIYICRNPLDQFVSLRHFLLKNRFHPGSEELLPLEQAFEAYCDGIHLFGPFWNHMLEYYSASLKEPERVLFLKYEELKEDVVSSLVKVAEFIGLPFSEEERERGVVDEIAALCSMENLKSLDVNKEGNKLNGVVYSSSFFRKGQVGDWKNHLTESMAKRVERILEEKFSGTGLTFESYLR